MKFFKMISLMALVIALWTFSYHIANYQLSNLIFDGTIEFGPQPDGSKNYYSFKSLDVAFNPNVDLSISEQLTKNELEELILNSTASQIRQNLRKFIAPALKLSEDYQVDPFWTISIMIVESGLISNAKSPKNAKGIMQIKPETAEHLYSLMGKKIIGDQLHINLINPVENIEIGIFYLKKLHQNFRLNYSLATIAYNLGPNKLKELLVKGDVDIENYSYYKKVQEMYGYLTRNFSNYKNLNHTTIGSNFVILKRTSPILESLFNRAFFDQSVAIYRHDQLSENI